MQIIQNKPPVSYMASGTAIDTDKTDLLSNSGSDPTMSSARFLRQAGVVYPRPSHRRIIYQCCDAGQDGAVFHGSMVTEV